MAKVSIIVIAYNIQDYIIRCLNSIINQTFKEIEIIVVNDGSTDNTLNNIESIAILDDRIKLINKSNEGAIEARRSGYKESKGEYILFVDGDDWLDENAIEILYNTAQKGDYDIVSYDFFWAYEYGKLSKNNKNSNKNIGKFEFLKSLLLGDIDVSVWNKFIKKNFIENNKIKFPTNITYGEDLVFSCMLAIYRPNVYIIDYHLYYYYQRNTSITNTVSHKVFDISKATNLIKDKLIENNLYEIYKDEFEYCAYYHNYYYRIDLIFKIKSKYSKKLYNEWKKMKINIYKNRYYKEKFKSESIKVKFVNKIIEKNYIIGRLYYTTVQKH